ncbi:uncharacterized protein L969DRAFT_45144 [Mixia osmundae IAM 14324]|uniref:tRNA dimethylallyltransferase n=1 Tax=Mixia osmundae (strain CBS 9802 / IAM 14324 / JCM 22182 / KY 12970) TaxID=764103 RepID=G7DYR5_MIXOS|nr:uncharacterized protein L969DRAFT_45144 [Mixia osmundae IAM 14324]KEI41624.1 hypothetical protein L969DRAFT_45144 [Mixia osmundae IAM 14324]GAA95725.1 hypothetical protein E5Q_02382 [Mixia osmundae IAM 14324]
MRNVSLTSLHAAQRLQRMSVVAVIGTTGVGKSQLAVELAQRLEAAEIINCDAMQLYAGLPLLTNKATRAEQGGIKHHLLGVCDPMAPKANEWDVKDYVHEATKVVSQLHDQRKTPILVGGTTYYLQNLLFAGGLAPTAYGGISGVRARSKWPPISSDRIDTSAFADASLAADIQSLPSDEHALLAILPGLPPLSSPFSFPPDFPVHLLPEPYRKDSLKLANMLNEILLKLDPVSGNKWPKNDVRKNRRALEICLETGLRTSDVYAMQKRETAAELQPSGGTAKYRSLILWLYSEPKELEARLLARANKMVQSGLLGEVATLRRAFDRAAYRPSLAAISSILRDVISLRWQSAYRRSEMSIRSLLGLSVAPVSIDYSRGIAQSLGFRPFDTYLNLLPGHTDEKALAKANEQMFFGTRQYARRQVKWIRKQLLPLIDRNQAAPDRGHDTLIYVLDATDLSQWQERVADPAIALTRAFLDERNMPKTDEVSSRAGALLAQADRAHAP